MERIHTALNPLKEAAALWRLFVFVLIVACNGGGGGQGGESLSLSISSVSPSEGYETGGTQIRISGSNLEYAQSLTLDGQDCSGFSRDGGDLLCTTPPHAAGPVTVRVYSQNEGAATSTFTYIYEDLEVTSFSPSAALIAGGTLLNITGRGFNPGVTVSIDGTPCTTVAFLSSTSIRCTTPALAAGSYSVVVEDANDSVTAVRQLIVSAPPAVTLVTPIIGSSAGGTVLSITGSNFDRPTVSVGTIPCTITAKNSTSITCTTGAGTAGRTYVRVQNVDGNGVTVMNAYTYILNPRPATVTPSFSVPGGGATITIDGTNFKNGATVDIGGTACAPVTFVSSSRLTCVTPAKAVGFHAVRITNPDTITGTLANGYESRELPPTLTSVAPTEGFQVGGQTITLTGTDFLTGATVTVGGTACTSPTVVSSTSVTCTTPTLASPGKKNVVIRNTDNQTSTLLDGIEYFAAPAITSVSPIGGPLAGGTTISIVASGLRAGALPTVTVGGNACAGVAFDNPTTPTLVTCTTAAHVAGATDVVVTNQDTQTNTRTNGFTFAAAPTVTAVTPGAGRAAGGALVVITGTGFTAGAIPTFDGSPCNTITVDSPTQITCRTPGHDVGTVDVAVTNTDTQQGTLVGGYIYQLPPTVTVVSPQGGSTSGGTSITISGTNFIAGATVTIGLNNCPVTATTATSITCTTPGNVASVQNVKVTNPDTQSATLGNGFTYLDAPVVTSVSPNSGALAGNTTVTINGANFIAGATVDFGGSACGSVAFVSSTKLTCVTPAHAAGAVTVTVTVDTQPGATANAYTYSPAPDVTAVSPVAGALAGGTVVTITGTDFVTGATVDLGGSDCAVSASTATSITCTTSAHAAGAVGVKVTNPDTQNDTFASYTYQAAPVVTAISPSAISSAGGTAMTITGTDFDGTPTVTLGGTSCPVTASTATSITCTSPAHAAGAVNVVVTNSDTQTGTLTNTLVYLDAPTVASVSPVAGALAGGTTLTITGTNFFTGLTVDIGGSACNVVAQSGTSITCTTTAHAAATAAIVVTNVDAQTGTLAAAFTYQPAPTVTSVAFNAGAVGGGTTVTVNGTGFLTGADVKFDTSTCVVTGVTATAITCITPAHSAGTVNVTVTNTDTQTNTLTNAFTYQVAPTVSTVSPAVGPIAGGTSVTVTGTGFQTSPSVSIGSVGCTVTASTSTSITCTTGARASGVVDVQVTNSDSQSGTKTDSFTYLDAPTVSAISPAKGALGGGTTVTITGTNFYTGATVNIGGSSCTILSSSATSISCRTTSHAAGSVGVTVTNVDAQTDTLAGGYEYRAAPTVSAVSPTYGPIGGGTTLTITGTGFDTGATKPAVTVGSSSCGTVNVTSATSLTCITSLSMMSGSVAVTVTNPFDLQTGTKSAAFIYLYPPTVTSVSPSAGALAGGSLITITGTAFFPGATVTVGGINCTPVTYISDTSISCTTGGPGAGVVDVVVTNPDAQSGTRVGGFTYQAAPTITSVSPASGPLGGGTGVTISGTGFVSGATVKIGTGTCTSVVVSSSTSITCNTPPGLAGTVGIQVTNADGQSDTVAGLYTYQAAPTISTVSPTGGPLAGGASITITGTGFLTGATVNIGSVACGSVNVVSSTSITCTTGANTAGSYVVQVRNTDNQTGSKVSGYTYQGAPTISAISPAVGASLGGTAVTISGTNFLSGATVSIGGTNCAPVTVSSSTSMTCVTGAHAAGTGVIAISNTDGQSGSGGSYLYQNAPSVTSVSPSVSPTAGNVSVTVTGTGFLTGAVVRIGGSVCTSPTVVSSTSITCTAPAKAAATYDIVVTNTDTQSGTLAASFSYQGAPTVSSVSPSFGDVGGGQVLTVTGTNFLAGALVTISGTSCAVSSVAATSITCTTGAKLAGTYDVIVTNSDAQAGTRASAYTYANAPTVTSVNPTTGNIAGGTTVTITGTNFYAGSSVDFGGSACTSVNIVSQTSITCITPAHAVGAVDISVINSVGATGFLSSGFTYTSTPATLAFVTGSSSPTPPNPDTYGPTTTNVSHTYTLRNTGATATTNVTMSISGANSAQFQFGTDTCTGSPLAAGATCTVQVIFLGQFSGAGSFTATLSATAATGGTVTNTMNGVHP